VSLYWIGRRDWPNLRRLVFWSAALGAVQLLLEPRGTLAYLSFPGLSQVGNVNNFSVYAISPAAWAVFVVGGVIVSLLLARTRWGWPVAVAFSVLATPRLITYQLMALLVGLGSPDRGPEAQAEEQST
jgi:hypothetical protein